MMVGKNKAAMSLILSALFFWLMPAVAEAVCTVNIGAVFYPTVQSAVNAAGVSRTITVGGTCNENVVVAENKLNVTLDGQTTATLNGPDATKATIQVKGSGITIKRFAQITGGQSGIQVLKGGTAQIRNNTIQGVGQNGILVNQSGSASIINNTIQSNTNGNGIVINEQAQARIGFLSKNDVSASPNTIQNNGSNGIVVEGSSDATIVGNTIANNGRSGIIVHQVSHADIADNTIDGNVEHGINVGRNSGVDLGKDTGSTIFDLPNSTTVNNTLFGINCFINSYLDGRQGTINGTSGAITSPFSGSCVNSLIP
jgi:parallel beta-helix repeat protein